jgi:hypothetical protein
MEGTFMRIFCLLFALGLATSISSLGQAENKPFEVGAHFTGLHLNTLGERAAGIGGRSSYELTRGKLIIAPEIEFNYFPQNPDGNFGESELLTGVKAGFKAKSVGFFVKVRPGMVHFGGADFKSRNNGSRTNLACDVGAILEYPASGRVSIRVDLGDTLIHFSAPVFTGQSTVPTSPGRPHNFQGGVGIVFRF